ncbi:MAG: hypothetical protein R3F43_20275 [bacterium]
MPILVAGVRAFITDNLLYLLARDDLSAHTESLLGDGSGPGSAFNQTRQFLSELRLGSLWGSGSAGAR